MRSNALKDRLRAGDTAVGTMVQEVASPAIAQIMHSIGFDFFMIDGEHSPFNPESVRGIVTVGRLLDITPLVRVRNLDYSLIASSLFRYPQDYLRTIPLLHIKYTKGPNKGGILCCIESRIT